MQDILTFLDLFPLPIDIAWIILAGTLDPEPLTLSVISILTVFTRGSVTVCTAACFNRARAPTDLIDNGLCVSNVGTLLDRPPVCWSVRPFVHLPYLCLPSWGGGLDSSLSARLPICRPLTAGCVWPPVCLSVCLKKKELKGSRSIKRLWYRPASVRLPCYWVYLQTGRPSSPVHQICAA